MSVSKIISVYIPVVVFVFLLLAEKPFPDFMPGLTGSELGLVESVQALLLFLAYIPVIAILLNRTLEPIWLYIWFGMTLPMISFVLLEEISYGQHYLNWDTPEYWQAYNDQNETNLHNTSSWLDQKPRIILEIGVIIGGLIVPFLRRYNPAALPKRFLPILPDSALFTTALIAIGARVYERALDMLDLNEYQVFVRTSEVQEVYFYYLIFLYFVFVKGKFKTS